MVDSRLRPSSRPQKDLPDWCAVAIKGQGAALSVHRRVKVKRLGIVVPDRRNLRRTFEINGMVMVFTELRSP